jgi:DNA replication and repair protein RecF
VWVTHLTLRNFRTYERAELDLPPGVTVVHGPVGVGKTNMLEAIYFGCVGRSFRTSNDRELVRFGAGSALARVTATSDRERHILEAGLELGHAKVLKADGVRAERLSDIDYRPLLCVFAPDRLTLVKGPAGVRRAHLDEVLTALWPARRAARSFYARALGQRNALLGRVRAGVASQSSLGTWNREVASHGFDLMTNRAAAVDLLREHFVSRGLELGLPDPIELRYRPRSSAASPEELERELEQRVASDLERGFTVHGPHRDDLALLAAGRDLRHFGSQGQQRLGLLALLLAERDVLDAERGKMPILLLDDVMSELDQARRSGLLELLSSGGQALITTADPQAPGLTDDRLSRLRVEPGGAVGLERAA